MDHAGGRLHAHDDDGDRPGRRAPRPAGEPVLMLYASANRDESVFGPTADRFDAARDPNPHVAFGFGPHFCIGAVLARLEGRVLLEELLARFGSVERAGPVVRTPSPVIAGVRSAPLSSGSGKSEQRRRAPGKSG